MVNRARVQCYNLVTVSSRVPLPSGGSCAIGFGTAAWGGNMRDSLTLTGHAILPGG